MRIEERYFLHDQEVVAAALGHDPQLIALYSAITNRAAATTADVKFNDNVFFDADDGKVKEFIRRMGFDLNEICMADYLPERLGSLGENPEIDAAVRDVFRNMMFWELTVAANTAGKSARVDKNLPFKVETEMKDGVFFASIQGRMDTITAPELLKQFKEVNEKIHAIHVDVSRMAYVSSAGLRVLLIIKRRVKPWPTKSPCGCKRPK